jgi:hypothetical protein
MKTSAVLSLYLYDADGEHAVDCSWQHKACIGKSAAFGGNIVFRTGAPRSVKMGTTASP